MSSLPILVRTCARRTATTTTTLSSQSTTSSTRSSFTRIQLQQQHQHQQLVPSHRFLSTSTSTPSPAPPSPSTFPPSNQPQPQQPAQSQQQKSKQQSSTPLSTTSPFLLTGTITRTGTMKSCIQITQQSQVFDPFLRKHYVRPVRMLIHDPHPPGFLVEGDVIEFGLFSASERNARLERKKMWEEKMAEEAVAAKTRAREGTATTTTKTKKKRGGKKLERTKWRGPKMVVRRVVTPFGMGVEERWGRIRELERKAMESGEVLPVASKRGRVGKQHASAKVAG